MTDKPKDVPDVAGRWRIAMRLRGLLRALFWFWPGSDTSADWSSIRRLIMVMSLAVGLAGSAWVLVSELQQQRFSRKLHDATTATIATGIARNIAVMDYASAALLAETDRELGGALDLQITDRYGFLIYGPEQIDMSDYPPNAEVIEQKLFDTKAAGETEAVVIGTLRQVVALPYLGSILLRVALRGLAVAFLFGSVVAVTLRYYMRTFVTAPLEKLTEAVARTSQTGKHARVEYLSESSFGIFARNFNRMQERLERQDQEQAALLTLNREINDHLQLAYDKIRDEQRAKLAQFEALGRVLNEADITLAYIDRGGNQIFSSAGQHPVAAIAEVLRQRRFDGGDILQRLTAAGLSCHFVSNEKPGRTEGQGSFGIEVAAPDGRTWVLIAGPRDTDGQVILCTDISRLREMEQELRQKQKMEALGRLVGGVAHEFNNMLAIISGSLDLLELDADRGAASRPETRAAMRRATDRAAATVAELLAFSRPKGLNRRRFEIGAHFSGLAAMLRSLLGPGITLDTEIASDIIVDCDPDQLDGAIINLATNARDAMRGAGTLYLRVFARSEWVAHEMSRRWQNLCVIEIEDTGPGVPKEVWHKVFDPFFSTKAATGKGVGLGLAAVSGFVDAFGGSVEVRDGATGGALFTMKLPAGGGPQARTAAAAARTFIAGGMRCLVLDDEPEVRDVAMQFLKHCGFSCDAAMSLKEASGMLSRHPAGHYQLLLCDLQLSDGNGAEFLPHFRAANPDARIICVSGNSDAFLPTTESGLIFLGKPYSFATLNEALSDLFGATT